MAVATLLIGVATSLSDAAASGVPYGLATRREATPYVGMPRSETSSVPQLLSQTGLFKDLTSLSPMPSLIPYDLNVAFWSDGAGKARWISVPHQPGVASAKIGFTTKGEWTFPEGTVFVKHFEMRTNESRPDTKTRLETRVLVRDSTGGVYGVTYKWRSDNSDADLVTEGLLESLLIKSASGLRTQRWYYPSPSDCRMCHTPAAGGVLGVKTRQVNRDFHYAQSGVTDNQLRAWNHIGLFEPKLNEARITTFPKLGNLQDESIDLESRARSYLDANCAQCHRPGGAVSYFDARYDTPLSHQNLINGPVVIDHGIDNARVIAPNDIWRSLALLRINTLEPIKMPPVAHEALDLQGIGLLRDWIHSLGGPDVLEPPIISPKGGELKGPVKVVLSHSNPTAEIRYTLNGGAPGKADTLYQGPFELTGPATVRARAYKPGLTKSITVQQTFLVSE
jgi:uncharacterized repeat protein (TIGR03806 family)